MNKRLRVSEKSFFLLTYSLSPSLFLLAKQYKFILVHNGSDIHMFSNVSSSICLFFSWNGLKKIRFPCFRKIGKKKLIDFGQWFLPIYIISPSSAKFPLAFPSSPYFFFRIWLLYTHAFARANCSFLYLNHPMDTACYCPQDERTRIPKRSTIASRKNVYTRLLYTRSYFHDVITSQNSFLLNSIISSLLSYDRHPFVRLKSPKRCLRFLSSFLINIPTRYNRNKLAQWFSDASSMSLSWVDRSVSSVVCRFL